MANINPPPLLKVNSYAQISMHLDVKGASDDCELQVHGYKSHDSESDSELQGFKIEGDIKNGKLYDVQFGLDENLVTAKKGFKRLHRVSM